MVERKLEPSPPSTAESAADVPLTGAIGRGNASPAVDSEHPAIERLLAHEERTRLLPAGLHVGVIVDITARKAIVALEGGNHEAALGDHVDIDFLRLALASGEPVLLQNRASAGLIVLGVVQGKHPSKLVGDRVEVMGTSEVVVRSGKSALRLREDGVVDLIGARISASSRGLLRLVGRALRLN